MRFNTDFNIFEPYINFDKGEKYMIENLPYGGISDDAPKEAKEAYERYKKEYFEYKKRRLALTQEEKDMFIKSRA